MQFWQNGMRRISMRVLVRVIKCVNGILGRTAREDHGPVVDGSKLEGIAATKIDD